VRSSRDPLQQDLLELAEAARASRAVMDNFPGLETRYHRLCRALRAARPARRLPPVEASLESVILHLLGAAVDMDEDARDMLSAIAALPLGEDAVLVDDRNARTRGTGRTERLFSGGAFRAPRHYHPPLPVPLWGRALQREPSAGREEQRPEDDETRRSGAAVEGRYAAERRRLSRTERDDPLLLNPFEKMLSWAEMVNVNRHVEDDDEEDARKAAGQLEQLTLSRHRKQTAARLKMDLDLAAEEVVEERLRAPLTYPEWHYRKRTWLPGHCAVYTSVAPEASSDWHPDPETRRRIRRVRRQFEALRPRRELLRAQVDGDELDLDAVIRDRAERAAGGFGSDKLYTTWLDRARDLAVAVLVDVSLSTEAWIEDRRVLDVEKEALLVLAHGIEACGDDQAIFTFTSRRRQRVDVATVKEFDEPMGSTVENRIAGLRPGLYTRMGAAVRHVTERLAERPNRHRLLLLLTDGKPNDTDYYEGRFAVEDTRMAVREARRRGLTVFGVTVDAEARQYFPVIFGRAGYAIIVRPKGLAAALPAIYRQLVASR
jgi:nitric oxide reductase NorD protein